MLAKIAPRFVISRVIQNAYYADLMSVQLLKQPFGTHLNYFGVQDAHHFYQCKFYGYISTLPAPTEFSSQYEAKTYEQAVEKLQSFNSVLKLVEKIDQFTEQLRYLYSIVERNNSRSNIFAHHKQTSDLFQNDILHSLDKYNKLLADLQPYPEWQDKIESEVGKWLHIIHNNLEESETKREIFSKMDRQKYFI